MANDKCGDTREIESIVGSKNYSKHIPNRSQKITLKSLVSVYHAKGKKGYLCFLMLEKE